VLERADIALIVCAAGEWGQWEEQLLSALCAHDTPAIVVFNKRDDGAPRQATLDHLQAMGLSWVQTNALSGAGLEALKSLLVDKAPAPAIEQTSIAADLVPPGELALLVVPIDKEAPKGRLILPQVQTIRDLLDGDAMSLVVKERELERALESLKRPPALVITDSQAFLRVVGLVPSSVPLTSFSVLFSRFKGDLLAFVDGARVVNDLQSGDRILMLEACAHRPLAEDIGRVKIPRWLRQIAGELHFDHVQGHDFPKDLSAYGWPCTAAPACRIASKS
jgi:[FeFe] hydrogenase H-cluster maturation GTPase HydF